MRINFWEFKFVSTKMEATEVTEKLDLPLVTKIFAPLCGKPKPGNSKLPAILRTLGLTLRLGIFRLEREK